MIKKETEVYGTIFFSPEKFCLNYEIVNTYYRMQIHKTPRLPSLGL